MKSNNHPNMFEAILALCALIFTGVLFAAGADAWHIFQTGSPQEVREVIFWGGWTFGGIIIGVIAIIRYAKGGKRKK